MLKPENGDYIEVDSLKTFYVKRGSGYPIVLLHGGSPGACTLVNFALNIEPLAAEGFTVYGFDQAGFGLTDNPEDFSLEYRVKHARAFLDAMGVQRYHLLGNSQGAYVAARLALEKPDAGRMVLISSATLAPPGSSSAQAAGAKHSDELRGYDPSVENMRKMTLNTIFKSELVTDDLVELRYQMSIGKNRDAQMERTKTKPARPVHEDLRTLPMPVMIMSGRNDRGVPLERSILLFESIPGAEMHIFDQCAHFVQWDQADRVNRLVADFLPH